MMTFTLEDIEAVKVGCSYVELVRRLKQMGVLACSYDLHTGIFTYQGDNNYTVTASSNGFHLNSEHDPNPDGVRDATVELLEAKIDFEKFCYQIAQAGVSSWETNFELLHIEYKNKDGKILMRESIPTSFD